MTAFKDFNPEAFSNNQVLKNLVIAKSFFTATIFFFFFTDQTTHLRFLTRFYSFQRFTRLYGQFLHFQHDDLLVQLAFNGLVRHHALPINPARQYHTNTVHLLSEHYSPPSLCIH